MLLSRCPSIASMCSTIFAMRLLAAKKKRSLATSSALTTGSSNASLRPGSAASTSDICTAGATSSCPLPPADATLRTICDTLHEREMAMRPEHGVPTLTGSPAGTEQPVGAAPGSTSPTGSTLLMRRPQRPRGDMLHGALCVSGRKEMYWPSNGEPAENRCSRMAGAQSASAGHSP